MHMNNVASKESFSYNFLLNKINKILLNKVQILMAHLSELYFSFETLLIKS